MMFSGLGKYDAVYADIPWLFSSNSKAKPGRNAMRHYDCMTVKDIAALPVKDIAKDNCALFLWITGPMLLIGAHIPVMEGWGFKPSGMGFVWIKLKKGWDRRGVTSQSDLHFGQGFTTRKNAEYCLIGKRGKSVRKDASVHEVVVSEVREHSRKPEEVAHRIRKYCGPDANLIELFARSHRPGWDVWGDETDKF